MLCEKCKAKQANTHIKQVINGEVTEMNLCSECAEKVGYNTAFDSMFDIGSMMSGFLGMPSVSALAREEKCPACGSTFSQISKSGKVGCARCYDTFYDRLLPTIKRIHGNTLHTGKRLKTARLGSGEQPQGEPKQTKKERIDELSEKLAKAVKAQEFEQAAKLRDAINELKAQGGAE